MNEEGAGAGLVILAIAAIWVVFGTPMRDLRSWTGNETYQDQLDNLTDFLRKEKIGGATDYWLTKSNYFGDADRVSLIFGLGNDFEFCSDLATLYMSKYPASRYYCMPANAE